MEIIIVVGVLLLMLVLVFIIAVTSVRIVSPYEKGVIERLGRYQRTAEPGLHFIGPFIDTMRKVDMREQVVDVQPQEVITKDNVVVTVDAIIYYEATDPVKLTYNVADFYSAATKLAQTNLRNVVGETELDQALTSREMINTKLRVVLDDATDKWGTRIVRVEIKRIDPPTDVTAAMHRQMKAERDKRASILEAEGLRQSAILAAEGQAEAVRRVADAERYKLEVEATGQGNAIATVYGAILDSNLDERVIAIQYLETLKQVANGTAAKVFIPYEATAILGALGGIQEVLKDFPGNGGSGGSSSGAQSTTDRGRRDAAGQHARRGHGQVGSTGPGVWSRRKANWRAVSRQLGAAFFVLMGRPGYGTTADGGTEGITAQHAHSNNLVSRFQGDEMSLSRWESRRRRQSRSVA